MVIFEYRVSPAWGMIDEESFCVTMTDDLEGNVVTRILNRLQHWP